MMMTAAVPSATLPPRCLYPTMPNNKRTLTTSKKKNGVLKTSLLSHQYHHIGNGSFGLCSSDEDDDEDYSDHEQAEKMHSKPITTTTTTTKQTIRTKRTKALSPSSTKVPGQFSFQSMFSQSDVWDHSDDDDDEKAQEQDDIDASDEESTTTSEEKYSPSSRSSLSSFLLEDDDDELYDDNQEEEVDEIYDESLIQDLLLRVEFHGDEQEEYYDSKCNLKHQAQMSQYLCESNELNSQMVWKNVQSIESMIQDQVRREQQDHAASLYRESSEDTVDEFAFIDDWYQRLFEEDEAVWDDAMDRAVERVDDFRTRISVAANAIQQYEQEEERKRQEMIRRKKMEEEATRKRIEEEEKRKQKAREEAEAKKRADEEERKRKEVEAEAERKKQQQQQEEAEQLKKQQQLTAAAAAPTAKTLTVGATTTPSTPVAVPANISSSVRAYAASKKRLAKLDEAYKAMDLFKTDKLFKDEMLPVRKQIFKFVNQLSCAKIAVVEKATTLHELINKYKNEDMKYKYCLIVLAERVVSTAGNLIASELASAQTARLAFPYASLMMFLCQKFPDCLDIFLGVLNKACIYTVPQYYTGRSTTMSNEDFLVNCLGYSAPDERQAAYYDRMAGIIALFAAFLQVDSPGQAGNRFYRIDHAWSWLAQFLNTKPTDISATILDTFLNVAGWALCVQYRKQFMKVLLYIQREFLPECPKNTDFKGPLTTLNLFITEALKTGQIKKPEGRDLSDSTGNVG